MSNRYVYEGEDWVPKEKRTVMANTPEGSGPVERVPFPERVSTEPDYRTSRQPRFAMVAVRDEVTRNLQTVLFCTSADVETRRRALKQLRINAAKGDLDAAKILAQWDFESSTSRASGSDA
jgi:hypothetical protein